MDKATSSINIVRASRRRLDDFKAMVCELAVCGPIPQAIQLSRYDKKALVFSILRVESSIERS